MVVGGKDGASWQESADVGGDFEDRRGIPQILLSLFLAWKQTGPAMGSRLSAIVAVNITVGSDSNRNRSGILQKMKGL